MKKIYSLLVLLFMGSASLQAQSSDPFGEVNTHKYQNNMTVIAQVQQNGNVITDAIVAVYCENELRGKNSVGDSTNPNFVYLTVYGEYTGSDQYLYFKVYTNGKTFTYNPNPTIIYTYNGSLGTETEPYIIDITPVSLANDADNSGVLTTYKGQTIDIDLTGRTLFKDGAWNTLCLPFSLTADEVTAQLAPNDLMTLESSAFDSSNGTLTLNFESATAITAGKPYLIRWTKPNDYTGNENSYDLTPPIFTGVTVPAAYTDAEAVGSALDAAAVKTTYVDFVGTYSPVGIYTADHTKLYLGDASTLYYPTAENFKINACRAYFQLKNGLTAGNPASPVRAFTLNFDEDEETTGVRPLFISPDRESTEVSPLGSLAGAAWYTLDGRRLDGKPSQRGVYISNGKKVVIK